MRPTTRIALAALAALLFLVADAPGEPTRVSAAVGDIIEFPVPTANSQPYSIVRAWDGNVWFNGSHNKLGRLGPTGITEFLIATPGGVNNLALAVDGTVWFTRANSVAKVSPDGVVTEYPVPVFGNGPGAITPGADDAMWFTYGNAPKIGRITGGGVVTVQDIATTDASGFVPITTDSDGNLWLAYHASNKVVRLTPALVPKEFPVPTPAAAPVSITRGPDGNLWFTEYTANKIGRITPAGAITEFPLPAGALKPFVITAGTDGALWFTEEGSNMIGRITTSGAITRYPVPTANSQPVGIASCGALICFTEFAGNKVGVFQNGSSIVVNTLVDANPPITDGLCSLREAIANANNNAASFPDCAVGSFADSITFGVSGTIVLAAALPDIADPAGLTIDGSGRSVTLSGNNAVRPFFVAPGAVAELRGLTVGNGLGGNYGGGIINGGTLTITNSTISGNSAFTRGGGIYNNGGTLTIDGSAITGNSTISGQYDSGDGGGGIYNWDGTLTITNSTISGNSAYRDGAGIYTYRLTLTHSTVSDNIGGSGSSGGGIYGGALTITSSTVTRNFAEVSGGGIFGGGNVTQSIVSDNIAGSGGGIYGAGTLTDSTVTGNTAYDGGGIHGHTLTITNSTISGNSAYRWGGGIYGRGGPPSQAVNVIDSTISGNSAAQGGGAYGMLTVSNSTISGNTGGGISSHELTVTNSTISGNTGGGIESNRLTVTNSTISGNSGVGVSVSGSVLTLTNSTVSGNGSSGVSALGGTVTNGIIAGNLGELADCNGQLVMSGPNLISDPSGCTIIGRSPITGDAKLGPLADNGGPTKTHALLPGSRAIDAGDDAVCAAAPVSGKDQRGASRPRGAHCDLGAYEKEPQPDAGGQNLRIATGSIDLFWDTGTAQTSYILLRYNTSTTAADLIPLAGNLTSYSDVTAVNGTMYCYVLAPVDGATVLGVSDLLCGMAGMKSGTVVPQNFALSFNQTANATLTWAPPPGGVSSYLLQRIPLDGSPITNEALGSAVTSTTQAVVAAGTCFQLIAFRVLEFGSSDVLCGVPGVSTLGNGVGGKVQTVSEALTAVERTLASVTQGARSLLRASE